MAEKNTRTSYRAPALERGLDILEHLAAQAPRTQSEIARALGKGSSEVFRMLAILESRGYIAKDAATGAYALTLRLFALSHMHSPYAELIRLAEDPMREFAHEVRESCHLSILHGGLLMVLAEQASPAPVRVSIEAGAQFAGFRTASGRLLLSRLPREELERALRDGGHFAKLKPAEKQAVLARIDAVRKRGYEEAEEESYRGVYDLSVPVAEPGGPVQAALTVACLAPRMQRKHPALLKPLRECAAQIGRKAGLLG